MFFFCQHLLLSSIEHAYTVRNWIGSHSSCTFFATKGCFHHSYVVFIFLAVWWWVSAWLQLLERALEASGDDIDSAIKSLNELCLESAAVGDSNSVLPAALKLSAEGTSVEFRQLHAKHPDIHCSYFPVLRWSNLIVHRHVGYLKLWIWTLCLAYSPPLCYAFIVMYCSIFMGNLPLACNTRVGW